MRVILNYLSGKTKIIYYDNGTNFYSASNQFYEVYNVLQSFPQMEKIQKFLAIEGCD
jgi:hypothetical protein